MSDIEDPLYMPAGEARLWQALIAVAQELSVAKDRIDLLERVLTSKGALRQNELEDFPLDDGAAKSRTAARMALVDRLIEPMRQV